MPIENNFTLGHIDAMHPWADALEHLRLRHGVSKNRLEENEVMTRSQYNNMLQAKNGPRIDVLMRVLLAIGSDWHEWAEAMEAAYRTRKIPTPKKRVGNHP